MTSKLIVNDKEKLSLTSKIFSILRDKILEGDFKKSEKLVEAKLAEELGVSRTPVREALKQLELEGLVENLPNRGVYVKGITHQDVDDIYTIRMAIEGISVEWAIERMTPEELKRIEEIYELMEFYTSKNDVDKISELNTKFHEAIYKATKSRYLEQILKDFQYYIKNTREKSLKTQGRLQTALDEHKEILENLKVRNKEAARKSLEKHIITSKENAAKILKNNEDDDILDF